MAQESIKQILEGIRNASLGKKNVFTITEVCNYLGCSKRHIYELTSNKLIPHYKAPTGKSLFFKRIEIDDWMCRYPVVMGNSIYKREYPSKALIPIIDKIKHK